jgi:hypothetical protein
VDVIEIHAFLTSALDRVQWPASRFGRFNREERAPDTDWIRIGGRMARRAQLEEVAKRKIPAPPPVVQSLH